MEIAQKPQINTSEKLLEDAIRLRERAEKLRREVEETRDATRKHNDRYKLYGRGHDKT